MLNVCMELALDPPRVQLWGATSPLKLLPASSSPKSRLEMSRMLIWFSLPLVMLCRAPSREVPVPAGKEELGQCRRVVALEMSNKKKGGISTKCNLKHPLPALQWYIIFQGRTVNAF